MHVCIFTSEFQSLPDAEEEGDSAVCLCFMQVLYVGVEDSALSVAACVAGHTSGLCVCVWVCDSCSALPWVEPTNRKQPRPPA